MNKVLKVLTWPVSNDVFIRMVRNAVKKPSKVSEDAGYTAQKDLYGLGKSLADLVGLDSVSDQLEEKQKAELQKATIKILEAQGKSKNEIDQAIAIAKASIQPLLSEKFSQVNREISSLLTKIQDRLDSTKLALVQTKTAVPGIKKQYREDLKKQTQLRDEAEGLAEQIGQQQSKAQAYGAAYDSMSEDSKVEALTDPSSSAAQTAKLATDAANSATSENIHNQMQDIERRL